MQSTQFSTTVLLFLRSAKPCVTATAHTVLSSNVVLTKEWIFTGSGLVRGHTVDLIIRGGSFTYALMTILVSVCVCACVYVCVCVCGGGVAQIKHLALACRLKNVFSFFIVIVIILWHAYRYKTPNYIKK